MHRSVYKCIILLCSIAFALLLLQSTITLAHPSASADAIQTADGIRVPIVMYHSIINNSSRWGTYVISSQELENDLKYLQSNGYTTITVGDLLGYVHQGKKLPDKPVMLTFDDGYYNNYLYAYPLLKKYNMKAVISLIGKYTDQYSVNRDANPMYSHITWAEAIEMVDSGTVELQNHSYDLHTITKNRSASMRVSGESYEHYEMVLQSDSIRLQSLIGNYTHRTPTAYTYPFGLISKESTGVLKEIGFQATLTCYPGTNVIRRDPECLFFLKRNLRPHGKSAETILTSIS